MEQLTEKELEGLLKLKRKAKKGGRFSKFIVVLVIFLNIAFTTSVLYIYLKVQNEPTTLIMSWFTFTTGELWLMASIKKKEVDIND